MWGGSTRRPGRTGAVTLRALHHVQLAMPPGGEAAARAFYAGLLGLAEVAKPAALAGRGGCWFESGPVRVHLGVEADFRPARKAHPAFLVTGLDGLAARLAAAGHPAQGDEPLPGWQRLFLDDPFGNRIELMEEADGG
ncbi:MAG: glyoxalase [Acetobacteraceae bacterium]|nr:glyoxalase [Acetobacteraceae bacterium]